MGISVVTSERMIGSQEEATDIIAEAKKLGPVGGIFDVLLVNDLFVQGLYFKSKYNLYNL